MDVSGPTGLTTADQTPSNIRELRPEPAGQKRKKLGNAPVEHSELSWLALLTGAHELIRTWDQLFDQSSYTVRGRQAFSLRKKLSSQPEFLLAFPSLVVQASRLPLVVVQASRLPGAGS